MRSGSLRELGLGLAMLALTSCQGTIQDRFGIGKRAPDDYLYTLARPV